LIYALKDMNYARFEHFLEFSEKLRKRGNVLYQGTEHHRG
jgi:hypothetical protein